MKSMLKLIAITAVLTEKERSDKKVSRQYYGAEFADPSNPFAKTVKRNFFQQHNADGTSASWKGADPKEVSKFIGKEIPGTIVNKKVEIYQIDDRDVDSFTTVILGNENEESVFKSLGHPILGTVKTTVAEEVSGKAVLNS